MKSPLRFVWLAGWWLLASHALRAELELASPFSHHAVLQREVAVPVWGWETAPAGSTVVVRYAGQSKETRVSAAGSWRVDLDPMPANPTGSDLVVVGSNTVTINDVVVGEVWLASGQSNMEWAVRQTRGFEAERARPAEARIRHLRIEHAPADVPATKVRNSGWQCAAPDTLGDFTGVGYYFARTVFEKTGVPVGIIHSSWGGTPVESWLPEPVLRRTRAWPAFKAEWEEAIKVFPEKYAAQPALEAAWQQAWSDNRTKGTPVTVPWPKPPMGPNSPYGAGALYNGMIFPLAPYALRGVLWYQGEANVGRHGLYAELFPAMIAAWRATWPLGDFPFLFVQLPNFADRDPAGRAWAQLREAQTAALHLPAVGMAVRIDGDEPADLHPQDKRPVGERLARIALHQVYDQRNVAWSGPKLQAIERTGASLRVRFTLGEGLCSTSPEVGAFEIAGDDRVFHPATATIDGASVVVRAAAVPAPVAVRYAYTNAPAATLVNAAGLPAAPFRSDEW